MAGSQFVNKMRSVGLNPSSPPVLDGECHQFRTLDRPVRHGLYFGWQDGNFEAGVFAEMPRPDSFPLDAAWKYVNEHVPNFSARIEAGLARLVTEYQQRCRIEARRAQERDLGIAINQLVPATPGAMTPQALASNHSFLLAHGIKGHGILVSREFGLPVVPCYSTAVTSRIVTAVTLYPTGYEEPWHCFPVSAFAPLPVRNFDEIQRQSVSRIIMAVGFIEAASVVEGGGGMVIYVPTAGDLSPVSRMLHGRFPASEMIFATNALHEPAEAITAAREVGGLVAAAEVVDEDFSKGGFNRVLRTYGPREIGRQLALAQPASKLAA